MSSKALYTKLSPLFKEPITSIRSVSGGDISLTYLVELDNSELFFLKANSNASAFTMFQREKAGLEAIQKTKTIKVPEVNGIESLGKESFLILEYIPTKTPDSRDLQVLGKELAKMHEHQGTKFGWDSDNFIGSLNQHNDPNDNWVTFYAKQRLSKQFDLAGRLNLLTPSEIPNLEKSMNVLKSLIPNNDKCLLHGDLWGGNYLISDKGKPVLIDPAVYYGDKMVDIAMSSLFGGFGQAFYDSYFYWSSTPENYRERIDIYQLYYLLVHLNLFGLSYYKQVKHILNRYF